MLNFLSRSITNTILEDFCDPPCITGKGYICRYYFLILPQNIVLEGLYTCGLPYEVAIPLEGPYKENEKALKSKHTEPS